MNHHKCADRFCEADIKVSQIIWLAGCCDRPNDAFSDFLDDEDDETVRRLLGVTGDYEDVMQSLIDRKKLGFLVELETPIPQNITARSE